MSKPWGKIGAWAADSERAEAEELAAASANPPAAAFPSLREAASAPKQKKKTNKMSLHEFSSLSSHSLSPSELLRLPTGPKLRSPDEITATGSRLGGGFSSYGTRVPREEGRRSYGGGFDSDGAPRGSSEFDSLPSRADEADNWGTGKKTNSASASFDSSGRNNKYTSLGSGRADDVDNWGSGKRAPAPAPAPERSTFGSGFRDVGTNERPRLFLDPPKKEGGTEVGVVKSNKPSPFGAARPREEVLAEKGLDWKKMEMEIEEKKKTSSRPNSGHSSRPNSAQSNRSESVEGVVKVLSRPKMNPFGDAKPREVLLQEKGLDWRKIDLDLDHRRVDRPETDAEKILKEEIDDLKKKFAELSASDANREVHEGATDDLHASIISKERDLELLIRELDDKVRFRPRVHERPGSGAGRVSGPPSRSELFDESRNTEFTERPRSRGSVDMWSRQSEERRAFQGGMERGFMGNRGMDRSRERW